mmetsp:Transcript_16943/g.30760  ORF Transcript_16943/g.30760 Transcript_16943/m.30760 type:complete len:310 (-) Transcript_16943:98-1027(-)|eukprot:CAMPEP_0202020172 /NCGR_PEP_ID=MMETSP0905-20130828/43847_1 /ASSEMBLY_ACC=CAM_ASM_000554 /TAXON_ID=420261 /ORGANISM="Thalassiosira antarctica, Strain CCMP982" /LENGTH=309 /DNA_ID=CAMNT_0048581685 /DNA_START=167 /DNA_END=1096 /DNA_ORIENTATION=-
MLVTGPSFNPPREEARQPSWDAFDCIEYLSCAEKDVDMRPSSREPSEVASSVSDMVNVGLVENLSPRVEMAARVPLKQSCQQLTNHVDLALARLLGPLANKALSECLDTIHAKTGPDGKVMVPEFGSLCDAAIHRAMDTLDATGAQETSPKSIQLPNVSVPICRRPFILKWETYELQVASLKDAAFVSFRGKFEQITHFAEFSTTNEGCRRERIDEFVSDGVKKLQATYGCRGRLRVVDVECRSNIVVEESIYGAALRGSSRTIAAQGAHCGDMSWLLPKPFGNYYRQEPHLTQTADDLICTRGWNYGC